MSNREYQQDSDLLDLEEALYAGGFEKGRDYQVQCRDGETRIVLIKRNNQLPAVLEPFKRTPHDEERMWEKGNTGKQSEFGVTFELALSDYLNSTFKDIPEVVELQNSFYNAQSQEEMAIIDDKMKLLWLTHCSREENKALLEQLEQLR